MYPEYFDNGLEIRKNEGCNLTVESLLPFNDVFSYENKDHEQFTNIPMNRSWKTYHPKQVNKNSSCCSS